MAWLQAIRQRFWRRTEGPPFGVWSFAQEGEDRILERFLGNRVGFFVDVGAHHPHRFSSTYSLYLKGWRGINIDVSLEAKALFDRHRPGDINLQAAISLEKCTRTLFCFDDPATHTLDPERAAFLESVGLPLRRRLTIDTVPLKEVLERHLPAGKDIDLLNVDVEGLDLEVLRSNDWDRYRPEWVLVEVLQTRTLAALEKAPITQFLRALGYQAVAKTFNTAFFQWGT